jgi:endonuclease III
MPTTQAEENEQQMKQIIRILKKTYPAAHCALNHTNPLELLIATMLSAQCTDERVNLVTATLFRKYRQAEDYVKVERTKPKIFKPRVRSLLNSTRRASRKRWRNY